MKCQFVAASRANDDRAMDVARVACRCWRCKRWRIFSQTPAYRQALLDGLMDAQAEQTFRTVERERTPS